MIKKMEKDLIDLLLQHNLLQPDELSKIEIKLGQHRLEYDYILGLYQIRLNRAIAESLSMEAQFTRLVMI